MEELTIEPTLLEKRWMVFVTLYKWWEIVWSSWNIIELEKTFAEEIIQNTIEAINDKRFWDLNILDLDKIKVRIDIVKNRAVLDSKAFSDLSPVKSWVIAIKKDYNRLAVILPNISTSLVSSSELSQVLSKKLEENFVFENFIVYSLETEVLTDF
jgi:AMMECR1 domain-containing protein